jgi:hypothetical protein
MKRYFGYSSQIILRETRFPEKNKEKTQAQMGFVLLGRTKGLLSSPKPTVRRDAYQPRYFSNTAIDKALFCILFCRALGTN